MVKRKEPDVTHAEQQAQRFWLNTGLALALVNATICSIYFNGAGDILEYCMVLALITVPGMLGSFICSFLYSHGINRTSLVFGLMAFATTVAAIVALYVGPYSEYLDKVNS